MAVSDKGAPVQVRLSSHSDGIIGDQLKTKDPEPIVTVEPKKKGRPKGSRNTPASNLPPPTLVPTPELPLPRPMPLPPPLSYHPPMPPPPPPVSHEVMEQFKAHMSSVLNSYEVPAEWAHYNIDPFVAYMVNKSQDVASANVNFEAMLFLYAQILNWEARVARYNTFAAQAHLYPPPAHLGQPGIDMITPPMMPQSSTPDNSRTYAELQTVRRGSQVTDATQVLHQHLQQESTPSNSLASSSSEATENSPESEKQSEDQNRKVLKQEAMTPMPNSSGPGSVNVMSVRPAPPSVSVVPAHMASQMGGKLGKIGHGDLVVSFNYRSSHFGPIYAESEEEVRAIVALTESKVEEREYRDTHGGRRSNGVYATAAATRYNSFLALSAFCKGTFELSCLETLYDCFYYSKAGGKVQD